MKKLLLILLFLALPTCARAQTSPLQILSVVTTGTYGCTTLGLGAPPCYIPFTGAVTLTTTGSSGPAVVSGNNLNIPQYTGGGSGSTALSALTSGTATNSIDSTSFGQAWAWSTLTTQTALTLATSNKTTGHIMALTNTSTASSDSVLHILDSTTSTGKGIFSSVSGLGNTGYAGYFSNSATTGYALKVSGPCSGCNGMEFTNGDSAYTIPATAALVNTSTTITAPRVWTLPAAGSVQAGQQVCVSDKFGGVAPAFAISVTTTGSDIITPSGDTSYLINNQYQSVCLKSDGTSVWDSGSLSPLNVSNLPIAENTFNCNPQNLKHLRKSLANVISGTGNATWFWSGDSTSFGYFSNSDGTVGNDMITHNITSLLANLLNGVSIPANSNAFAAFGNAVGNINGSRMTMTALNIQRRLDNKQRWKLGSVSCS